MERSEFFIFSMFYLPIPDFASVWVTRLGGNESHVETFTNNVLQLHHLRI